MIKIISYFNNITHISYIVYTFQLVIRKGLALVLILVAKAKRLIRFFMYFKQMEYLKEVQNTLNYEEGLGIIDDMNTC